MPLDKNGALSRRTFVSTLLALAGTGVAGLVAGYTYRVEPNWLALEQVRLVFPPAPDGHSGRGAGLAAPVPARNPARLPAAMTGLRIVQLSDLHRSPLNSLADISRAVDLAQDQAADMIVLTGDYVSTQADYANELVPVLARLSAPLGVYAVLGNHDYWTDAERVRAALQQGGVRVLHNEALPISRGGARIWLAGIEDLWEQGDDLPGALAQVPPGEFVVLLVHEPDFADNAADYGIALQLSGHSHGGQVRLPGLGCPILPYMARKYPVGLNRVGETLVYTNRGIGSHPLGLRLNCRPEVTVLTLAG
jgi:uncharacterized protein